MFFHTLVEVLTSPGSYISIFTIIIFGHNIFFTIINAYYYHRTVAASRTIHKKLIASVFGSTLRSV